MNKIKAQLNLRLKIPKVTIHLSKGIQIVDNRKIITKITQNIFISGAFIAKDYPYLLENQFTHIVNCSSIQVPSLIEPKIKTLSLYLKDDPSSDIITPLLKTIKFLENGDSNIKVLFHCVEGISRGPALLTGYLMWKMNLKKDEAISLITQKRPCVDINFGFLVQLNKWEIFLRGSQNKDEINLFKIGDNIFSIEEKEVQYCDNINDAIIVRLNNIFIYVGGITTKETIVDCDLKKNEFINFLTRFANTFYATNNIVSIIKTLVVNFKEFKQEHSFINMIKQFALCS